MKKGLGLIGIIILVFSLSAAVGFLWLEKKSVSGQLTQAKDLIDKLRKDLESLKTDKEIADKEKEKSQKDALSFVELNNKIQKEKEKIQDGLAQAQKMIAAKEADLERLKQSLARTEKRSSKEFAEEKEALQKQKKELVAKITALKATLKKDGSFYNYNLGVAFTQANLSDEAIEAYEKALEIDPDMAEAHYNLGLIYEDIEPKYDKALAHYQRYLELATDPADKDEATESINRLQNKLQNKE